MTGCRKPGEENMSAREQQIIYLCPNCFTPADQPGPCAECGTPVEEFCPGGEDDLCRRPVINSRGEICTHVPLWWIRKAAPALAKRLEAELKQDGDNQ
jgi:hypothetical protein